MHQRKARKFSNCIVCGKDITDRATIAKYCIKCRDKIVNKTANIRSRLKMKESVLNYGTTNVYRILSKFNISDEELKTISQNGCVVCGWRETMDFHHIDGNSKNSSLGNLVCLCPNHHTLIHRKGIPIETLLSKYKN